MFCYQHDTLDSTYDEFSQLWTYTSSFLKVSFWQICTWVASIYTRMDQWYIQPVYDLR